MDRRERARAETTARARRGTYSIVARDPDSGELGVAVQSHWFSVGPLVPWARSGVGAVATQANVEVSYGPLALDLLEAGAGAQEALAALLARDPGASGRQVAIVDSRGEVAVHTGTACIADAGHMVGAQVCCQANIMANATVWGAMLGRFNDSTGPLAERLADALEAAEVAGGDLRGRQSAAILVVPAAAQPWEATVSLRVEDHPEPLIELRRLLRLHRAYVLAADADELVNEHRFDEAAVLYARAAELAPESHELLFWSGLGAAQSGRLDDGVEQVRRAIALHPGWAALLPRLKADVAPAAPAVIERLGL